MTPDKEDLIRRQAELSGAPIPKKIENAPTLNIGLEWYFEAFQELSTDRAFGMSVGPIPWTAIDKYAERFGFSDDDDEYSRFVTLMRHMDLAYTKHISKNHKDPQKMGS